MRSATFSSAGVIPPHSRPAVARCCVKASPSRVEIASFSPLRDSSSAATADSIGASIMPSIALSASVSTFFVGTPTAASAASRTTLSAASRSLCSTTARSRRASSSRSVRATATQRGSCASEVVGSQSMAVSATAGETSVRERTSLGFHLALPYAPGVLDWRTLHPTGSSSPPFTTRGRMERSPYTSSSSSSSSTFATVDEWHSSHKSCCT
mmetsp:Transcript_44204/g.105252  ORF Transcript_44204/g.105252 Transcript_44204/m.105252 type:complete len:211 (+) Transcript_44204:412-1044(+)